MFSQPTDFQKLLGDTGERLRKVLPRMVTKGFVTESIEGPCHIFRRSILNTPTTLTDNPYQKRFRLSKKKYSSFKTSVNFLTTLHKYNCHYKEKDHP